MIDNPYVEQDIDKIRYAQQQMNEATTDRERERWHSDKSKLKKRLPAFVFQVGHIEPTEKLVFGKPMKAAWRKAEHARLNGLVMLDIDNIGAPLNPPKGGRRGL